MTDIIISQQITQRLPRIDMLRGIAVLAMIVYHFAWDLTFFGLIETNVATHPLWSRFAIGIAGSFLTLAGISLELSARSGLDRSKFKKRLLILTGAALLVSVGTYAATPNSFVFFGILHNIALGSVLALLFLKLPVVITAGVAAIVFVMPWIFTHAQFNQPALIWLGLGTTSPDTSDFIPIFPWFGFMLIGLVIAKLILKPHVTTATKGMTLLHQIGRRSLPIYLIHQPILMALIGAASLILPMAGEQRIADEFRTSCRESCQLMGSSAEICPRFCGCVEDKLKTQSLWKPILRNRMSDEQENRVSLLTEQCAGATR